MTCCLKKTWKHLVFNIYLELKKCYNSTSTILNKPQYILHCRYQEKLAEICKNLTQAGLKEKEIWDKDREAIFSSHLEAKANNQKESVVIIQQYEDTKQGLLSAGDIEKALAHLNTILDEMKHNLIKLEMILVEQLDVSCYNQV